MQKPLPIIVNPQASLSINAQVLGQIKLLISMGELQPDEVLPTVVELAKQLGINHNTVAAVYNELIESGYLISKRSKGTFVAQSQTIQKSSSHRYFYKLLAQAYSSALQLGINPSEFGIAAYAQATMLSQHKMKSFKLVFIEELKHGHNIHEAIFEAIKVEIGYPLLFLSLEDLKADQPKALKELQEAELIITTDKHLWEVTSFVSSEQEVVVVDVKPNLEQLTQISSLPRHTNLLLVSQEVKGAEVMKKMLQQSGISHLNFHVLSLENLKQNNEILNRFDEVCASKEVFNYVCQYCCKPENVISFHFSLDPANLSVLKARIIAIQATHLISST